MMIVNAGYNDFIGGYQMMENLYACKHSAMKSVVTKTKTKTTQKTKTKTRTTGGK